MAGVTKRVPERDEEQPGSMAYEVTKPFDPVALEEELGLQNGARGLIIEGDFATASKAEPVTLWVVPDGEVDDKVVGQAVASQDPPKATESSDWDALVADAADGKGFDHDQALRMLIARAAHS